MNEHTIVEFQNPAFGDELTEVLRQGARRLIKDAVQAELESFLESHASARDAHGRRAVVRTVICRRGRS